MDNIQYYLYAAAVLLTLAEVLLRWVVPGVRRNPRWAGWVETVDSLWMALLFALAVKAVFVQNFEVPSGSMEDTLKIGDYILVKKYEYGYSLWNRTRRFLEFHKPRRGDVLVFVYPEDHSKDFVKRCVGIPGDVLAYRDKVLYVNGVRQVEPYAKHVDPFIYEVRGAPQTLRDPGAPDGGGVVGTRDNFGPVTVRPGHYFMMGDNRDNSLDSRYWGQLDGRLIKGQAWLIYWHSDHFVPDFHRMFRVIH